MLSKDLVPVIYHDFHVLITYRKVNFKNIMMLLTVNGEHLSYLHCALPINAHTCNTQIPKVHFQKLVKDTGS